MKYGYHRLSLDMGGTPQTVFRNAEEFGSLQLGYLIIQQICRFLRLSPSMSAILAVAIASYCSTSRSMETGSKCGKPGM